MNEDTVGALTAVVAVATLPLGILAAMFDGPVTAGTVFVVGWLLLTPLIAIVGGTLVGDDDAATDTERDPIEELRERYARGEIDEREFEERVERLVETEEREYDPAAEPAWRRREHREERERAREEIREFDRERE